VIFNSTAFLVFFLVVYAGYWLLQGRLCLQNLFILVASYYFYAYWDWRFLSLLVFTTVVNFWFGLRLAREPGSRAWMTASVVVNLGVLGVFKYAGFFVDSAVDALQLLGFEGEHISLGIILPIGISFFTFQGMSYAIDVRRGHLQPCTSLIEFAAFKAFFPQLVAGPIERASHFLPQIAKPRRLDLTQSFEGLWLAAIGFLKKVFVADNLARIADSAFDGNGDLSGGVALLGVYAFAAQIYCDFSGYSDIARGLAKLLGFELMQNFDHPYVSRDPSEFWRRWHISLSTWLRDYLYIALGGNRRGSRRTSINLFATMALGGMWHGAAWTFMVWGAFHGALLIVHRSLRERGLWPHSRCIGALLTFHLVCVGWVFFRAPDLAHAWAIFAAVAGGSYGDASSLHALREFLPFVLALLCVEVAQLIARRETFTPLAPPFLQGAAAALIFYLIVVHGAVSDAFIYFQF
jgi:D-alanyl-lipoteichoic acid acyltransferase DltB (MBOAT superfamily)